MANNGETSSHQGREEINLANIGVNMYDPLSNKDEQGHTCDDINGVRSTNMSATKLPDSNGQTVNTRDTTLRSEVIVTRRMIVLAVIGSLLFSLISVIAGITVYHVTIAKMADSDKQTLQDHELTASPNPTDALALKVQQLENNLTTASDVWNDEIASLKNNFTTASDVWNEDIASLKKNISDLRQYKDCSELFAAGTVVDGVYTISPDGRCPFQVYCDMTGGGWTLIQKRIDGLVHFYRSWYEYADGFGNIDGEHWLGLDKINRLTADGSEIYFHLEYYNGTIGFAHYKSFTVHEAITAYRMNVDAFGYNGTINELFSNHNNMKFSTYDRDNDAYSGGNCCKNLDGGGWWYNACVELGNLNGVFGKREVGGIGYWATKNIPLKSANIKVKHLIGSC